MVERTTITQADWDMIDRLAEANVEELNAAFAAARAEIQARLTQLTPEELAARLKEWDAQNGR